MLFKETENTKAEEIKKYISVNVSTNYNTIKPYIEVAEREYIKRLLGDDQYEELTDYYYDHALPEERLDTLLEHVQRALINLAYYRGFPLLNVKMSDQGAYRNETEKQKSLFKYQESALWKMFKQDGFNGLDAILEYLEDNIDLFPEFQTSPNYTIFKSNFINTTKTFDDIYSIGGSRLVFLKLRRFMNIIEDSKIIALIGRAFFDELKTQIKEITLTIVNAKAVEFIQKAVAFYSIAQGLVELGINITDNGLVFETREGGDFDYNKDTSVTGDELSNLIASARKNGEMYLGYLKDHLHENIDDYPTYRDSDQYDETNTAHIRDNSNKKTFWT